MDRAAGIVQRLELRGNAVAYALRFIVLSLGELRLVPGTEYPNKC